MSDRITFSGGVGGFIEDPKLDDDDTIEDPLYPWGSGVGGFSVDAEYLHGAQELSLGVLTKSTFGLATDKGFGGAVGLFGGVDLNPSDILGGISFYTGPSLHYYTAPQVNNDEAFQFFWELHFRALPWGEAHETRPLIDVMAGIDPFSREATVGLSVGAGLPHARRPYTLGDRIGN